MKLATQKKKTVPPMVCDCGGRLRPAVLEKYDFSRYVGFKVTLSGMDGLKCDKCGWETLDGGTINHVLNYMVIDFTKFKRRLNGEEARYLRRSLSVTQEELATRMGVVRETVAKWECGTQEISPQHDFILRVLAMNGLVSLGLLSPHDAAAIIRSNFIAVRADPPEESTHINMTGVSMKTDAPPHRERREAVG